MTEVLIKRSGHDQNIASFALALAQDKLGLELDQDTLQSVLLAAFIYIGTRALLSDANTSAEIVRLAPETDSAQLSNLLSRFPVLVLLLSSLASIQEQGEQEPGARSGIDFTRQSFESAVQEIAHLPNGDASRLFNMVQVLSQALGEGCIVPEITPETAATSLNVEELARYFDDIAVRRDLAQPIPMLINLSALSSSPEISVPGQSGVTRFAAGFLDHARYARAAEVFVEIGKPFLADTARLLYHVARRMTEELAERRLTDKDFQEIDALLNRYDRYSLDEFVVFQQFSPLIFYFKFLMRWSIGVNAQLPQTVRLQYLGNALQDLGYLEETAAQFPEVGDFLVAGSRMMGPGIVWRQAALEQEPRRGELQRKAVEALQQLQVQATLRPIAVLRIVETAMLTNLSASWKYEQGEYRQAIELATMAKSLGERFPEAWEADFGSEQIEAGNGPPPEDTGTAPPIDQGFLEGSIIAMVSGLTLADLTITLGNAKLAEGAGRFDFAAYYYDKASEVENDIRAGFADAIKRVIAQAPVLSVSPNLARASYYKATASLNRGDNELIKRNFASATENYRNAKEIFLVAATAWREQTGKPQSVTSFSQQNPEHQAQICEFRARYCDVKIVLCSAERYARLQNHLSSATQFLDASSIFEELLENSVDIDEQRNLEILRASADYSRGRYLFELDLDMRTDVNRRDAATFLSNAEKIFARNREEQWATYLRALSAEYQAQVENPRGGDRVRLREIAEQRKEDAALAFDVAGVPIRTDAVDSAKRLPIGALPKPFESLTSAAPMALGLPQGRSESTSDQMRRQLQARAGASKKIADDLRNRFAVGLVDEGRYVLLATTIEEQRIIAESELEDLMSRATQY